MSARQDARDEIEVTLEMKEAGIGVSNLIGFRWGEDDSVDLVVAVYRAMEAARVRTPKESRNAS